MPKRIVIIQGHPDPNGEHFCHALAAAYATGAQASGHFVQQVDVGKLEFPWLRTKAEFEHGALPTELVSAQQMIGAADHLLIVYPLWMGDVPAVLKAFLEQIFRPTFAFIYTERGFPRKQLKGKSARIVITMGMPSVIYRWYFGAPSLKSLKKHVLRFCGINPIRHNLFGMVEQTSQKQRERWLEQMRSLGSRAI